MWAPELSTTADWFSIEGVGQAVSIRVRTEVTASQLVTPGVPIQFQINGFHLTYQPGGPM